MRSEFVPRGMGPIQGRGCRRCLRCRRPFDSEGPTERICGLCKLSEDWMWAMAATKGHIEW
ncbi:MAG TPA: hypothetical protein VMQ73_14120 [Methylomirabilota bacterium]|nr:hypothetical protein [Methylomirabilota bacterium]